MKVDRRVQARRSLFPDYTRLLDKGEPRMTIQEHIDFARSISVDDSIEYGVKSPYNIIKVLLEEVDRLTPKVPEEKPAKKKGSRYNVLEI